MADKIKSSYWFSKSFYDDAITQGKCWSKLYFKLLWGGVDDNEIARKEKVNHHVKTSVTIPEIIGDIKVEARDTEVLSFVSLFFVM